MEHDQSPPDEQRTEPTSVNSYFQSRQAEEINWSEAQTLELALQAHPDLWISAFSPPVESFKQAVKVTDEERHLLDYYLQKAGVWLDIVSSENCFAQIVPALAMQTPVLYSACVAYAAQHMFLSGMEHFAAAAKFHSQAINGLVPLLNPEYQYVSSDILLATTVLLRMSEQFSEPDDDVQCHMHGAFALVTRQASKWSPNRTDIAGVCFWVFVRQSLRLAFLFERQCGFQLELVDDSELQTPARDDVWTNRMTFLLAKVTAACYSQVHNDTLASSALQELEAEVTAWSDSIPTSFEPWYYRHPPDRTFPVIRYLNRWHAIGWQQYYTAKTMLAAHQRWRDSGCTYRDLNEYTKKKILTPARLACGVVFSEPDVGAGINGCHLACWCAQFFTGREEQSTVISWL